MSNKRHKILHLRGTKNLTIEHANELNFGNGEIAIKHGNNGESELYVLTQDGNNIDSFVTKTYIDNVANNITNDIIENEEVVATALTNLDNRLLDVESGTSVVFNEYVKKNEITKVATTGSYNDLTNKPTIPAEVTETTISNWGFTKNTGTYSKPNGGIPKSDLDSAVQTSLGKADTALQSIKTINGQTIVGTGNLTLATKSELEVLATKNEVETLHNEILNNEEVVALALTDLDDRISNFATVATTGSYNDLTDKPTMPTVDTLMSDTSTNAVQNKIIKSYIDNNCNIPLETTTVSSKTLSPNKYYKWTNSPSSITITLETPSNSNILNNYMFEFTVSETGCTLIVPDTIKWLNGVAPVLEATKTYQISIINNLATVAKFG